MKKLIIYCLLVTCFSCRRVPIVSLSCERTKAERMLPYVQQVYLQDMETAAFIDCHKDQKTGEETLCIPIWANTRNATEISYWDCNTYYDYLMFDIVQSWAYTSHYDTLFIPSSHLELVMMVYGGGDSLKELQIDPITGASDYIYWYKKFD